MSIAPMRKNRRKKSSTPAVGYLTRKEVKSLQKLQEIDKRVYNSITQRNAEESKQREV